MSIASTLYVHRRWVILAAALALGLVTALTLFAGRVTALRSGRASGSAWAFPAQVYSDEVTLTPGRVMPAGFLEAQLEARGYRKAGNPRSPGVYSRDGNTFEIWLRGFSEGPDPFPSERVRLRIREGRLGDVERLEVGPLPRGPKDSKGRRAEPERPSRGPARLEPAPIAMLFDEKLTWRLWTDLERVPEPVRDAIITSEDRRFRSHIGVDVRGYLRALRSNARSGQVREGGSTITQQLARSLFLGRERTLMRKLAEVPLALGLETVLGKQRILEMYLNATYWGQAGGYSVAGIAAASRWYFDEPPESLGVLEGATLAAIIPAPNVYNPFERPRTVRARRNRVLRDMVALGRLDAARAEALAKRPLRLRRGTPPRDRFPSYTGFIRDQLAKTIDPEALTRHGLSVFTRLDLVWQRQAEVGLSQALDAFDGWSREPRLEGAFVAIEPGTGAVRALVGGRAVVTGGFNRAHQARRQTGSAIKPIVYAAAFASNQGFTPATVVPDEPRTFQTDRGPWRPRNDDGLFHGQVTLAKALQSSFNVATTNLVDRVGPQEVARVAARFGLGALKPVMSIGLGSNESTVLDLTRAFAVFGDGGMLVPMSAVLAVTDRGGHDLLEAERTRESANRRDAGTEAHAAAVSGATRAIPEPVAALMTGLLTNVVRFGVAYPLRSTYGFTRPVAGKTGTTDEYKDAWFVGFTPDIVAGLWIGHDRPRSLGMLASQIALPAWAHVVTPMLDGFPPRPFETQTELEWVNVEPWSGRRGTAYCRSLPIPFLPGTAPEEYCEPMIYGPEWQEPDSTVTDSVGAEPPP